MQSLVAPYDGNDSIEFWLVNNADDVETAADFLEEADVPLRCLLDDAGVYETYPRDESAFAPYPLHVLIDADGVIRYLSYRYDPITAQAAIDAVLAE